MHVSHQVLRHLLDLELVVRNNHQVFYHHFEAVVVLLHVLDGQSLTQLQYQLLVPIDERTQLLICEEFGLDVDLHSCAVDDELEEEQCWLVLVLQVEDWDLVVPCVQDPLALPI